MLTGETGAGKTMVVTSLHLLSAVRGQTRARVRLGANRAVVEGRFSATTVPSTSKRKWPGCSSRPARERDEDGTIIAVRTVGSDGRSRAHLGGRSVPAGVLSEFTDPLLTVHGQNDQLRLLRPDQQRSALDRFGGKAIGSAARRGTASTARGGSTPATELASNAPSGPGTRAGSRPTPVRPQRDRRASHPQPGEDARLVDEVRRLSPISIRCARGARARTPCSPAGDDMPTATASALRAGPAGRGAGPDRIGATTPHWAALGPRLDDAIAVVTDVAGDLSGYLGGPPADPGALETLLTRQAELKTLTRKYAADVDGVLEWARQRPANGSRSIDVSAEALGGR